MADTLNFKSRTGILSCTPEDFSEFISDLRNLKQFMTVEYVNDLKIERENVSFNVSPLGNVRMWLSEKNPARSIIFSGIALGSNNFRLLFGIDQNEEKRAAVNVVLDAEISPILQMMVSGPVKKFLEILVSEMEKFTGWSNPYQQIQSP
ncbi:MAG: hypothetical protein RBR81_01010 [Bacteroidales bacterium]|jgi:hypothetical protein|nr:hypothetical protein [Bacteroidales bacterium]